MQTAAREHIENELGDEVRLLRAELQCREHMGELENFQMMEIVCQLFVTFFIVPLYRNLVPPIKSFQHDLLRRQCVTKVVKAHHKTMIP